MIIYVVGFWEDIHYVGVDIAQARDHCKGGSWIAKWRDGKCIGWLTYAQLCEEGGLPR